VKGEKEVKEWTAEWIKVNDYDFVIDEIMDCYGDDILKLAYSYVHSKEIAEDLAQDIFIKCYKNLHTYNGKSKFKTWLWRIAINHCKDFLKSWYNNKVIMTENQYPTSYINRSGIEEKVIQKQEDQQLISAIMLLPVKYREVIYLYYFEENSIKEIALVTETGTNTVKTRLRRAKALLKNALEEKKWISV